MKNQSGQSLIEVLVALVVVMVMVVALIIIVLGSLKNSQFAQKQVQATKYAQETIDKLKTIRDRDGMISFQNSTSTTCGAASCQYPQSCNFSILWQCQLGFASPVSPCTIFRTGDPQGCYFLFTNNDSELIEPNSTSQISYSIPNEDFKREIFMEDLGSAAEKKVTVKVKWTDASGDHESDLQTVLTQR